LLSTNETVSPRENADKRLWIHVSEPVRLRDYFRRLGAHAEVVASGGRDVVYVESADLELAAYLESWTTINNAKVSVTRESATLMPAVGRVSPARPRLGDLLLAKGMITEAQLGEGLAESYASGVLLGRVLLRHRWIFEDELARTLAEQLNLPYVNLRHTGVDKALARMLPLEVGMQFAAIPIGFHGDCVRVAFADPIDEQAHQAVTAQFAHFDRVVSELSDIEQALRTTHGSSATGS
jgi:MshEN domain